MVEELLSILIATSMLDSSAAGIRSTVKTKRLREDYYDLANEISKNTSLANQLIDAYNEKGARYAQELIGMSPFSTAYYNIHDAIKENDKKLAYQKSVVAQLQNQGQVDLNNKMKEIENAQSNSIIGDLISGSSNKKNFINKQFNEIHKSHINRNDNKGSVQFNA